jgi:hypothetical protein
MKERKLKVILFIIIVVLLYVFGAYAGEDGRKWKAIEPDYLVVDLDNTDKGKVYTNQDLDSTSKVLSLSNEGEELRTEEDNALIGIADNACRDTIASYSYSGRIPVEIQVSGEIGCRKLGNKIVRCRYRVTYENVRGGRFKKSIICDFGIRNGMTEIRAF